MNPTFEQVAKFIPTSQYGTAAFLTRQPEENGTITVPNPSYGMMYDLKDMADTEYQFTEKQNNGKTVTHKDKILQYFQEPGSNGSVIVKFGEYLAQT